MNHTKQAEKYLKEENQIIRIFERIGCVTGEDMRKDRDYLEALSKEKRYKGYLNKK